MTTLRLISREQDAFERALLVHIENFEALHPDVKVETTFLPIHDHFELMVEGDGCRTGEYDIFLCCTDWLPQVIAERKIQSIQPFIEKNPPEDWPGGWCPAMHELVHHKGETFAMPWHDGPEVLHYRADLFEDPAEQQRFQALHLRPLLPPTTWEDFLTVAQYFTRPKEGLWGCCEAAFTDGHNNVYDFLIQLWSRGGELWNGEQEPQFHLEMGQAALQYYVDLFQTHKVAPPECLNMGSVECGDFYAQGHAAMSWNWIGFAAICELPHLSRIVGKNRCTLPPGGSGPNGKAVSLNIYWGLTVTAGSGNAALAYEFLKSTASPAMDKATSMAGANGVRLSTWNDPDVLKTYPYYAIIEEVHKHSLTLPAIPEYPAINEAISRAVHRCLHEGAPVNSSLATAAEETRVILKGANAHDFA